MADEATTAVADAGVAVADPGAGAGAGQAAGEARVPGAEGDGGAGDVWDSIPDDAIDDNGDVDLSKLGKPPAQKPAGAEGDGKAAAEPPNDTAAARAQADAQAKARAEVDAKAAADAKAAEAAKASQAPAAPADLAEQVKQISDILNAAGKVKLADGTEFDFAQFHEEFPEVGHYQTAALAVLIDKLGLRAGTQGAEAAVKAAEQVAALQAEVGKMQWERGLTDLRADALKVIRSPEFKAWAVKFYEGATAGQRAVFDSNDPKDSLRIIDEFEQATGVTAKREAAKRQASKASLHSVGQPGGRGPAPGAARTVDEIWDKIPEDELD